MRPGDIIYLVALRQTSAAAPSTGKLIADFGFDSYLDGVVNAFTKTVTEGATTADGLWRAYKFAVTLPATAGRVHIRITPASGADIVSPSEWEGEVEANDLDSVYAVAAVPVASASVSIGPSVDTPITLDAYRLNDCSATRLDQTGAAFNLTGYTNARFSVWTRDHTGTRYTLSSGITLGGVLGTIAWSVPEDASFYTQIDAAITASQDFVTLYYDLVADQGGLAAKTVPLLKGTITLRRFEAAA
ncbi:hypothetical protein [Methylibium sp.]|uniref:hypothetical protein n=1 Tax=Methylibium sp. TaxID=2067992 RepID=UPI0018354D72|nr:hypothetical protein [Methylibium sp.]MBA3589677.1 hypothetical protein [Methylibium sp.]